MAGGNPGQRTAVIATVLDEASTIDALLESLASQSRPPDEVVVVDGGSRDGTWQRLQHWQSGPRLPLRLVRAEGSRIARGRNLAIAATSCDVVAVTDAGVRLAPMWLERLLEALDDEVDVVSGFFEPDPANTFERAMGATILPTLADVKPETFLPSSRSVLFRRDAWASIGGYPEWLDYGEDLVFDLALKRARRRFAFAPEAVAWFRPRGSFSAFFRQYFLYARGDGKANLWFKRHLIRYVTYATAAVLAARIAPARTNARLLALASLLLGALVYTWRPYSRLAPQLAELSLADRAYALALVPAIRLVGDIAKMLGYPVGVWWRVRLRQRL